MGPNKPNIIDREKVWTRLSSEGCRVFGIAALRLVLGSTPTEAGNGRAVEGAGGRVYWCRGGGKDIGGEVTSVYHPIVEILERRMAGGRGVERCERHAQCPLE